MVSTWSFFWQTQTYTGRETRVLLLPFTEMQCTNTSKPWSFTKIMANLRRVGKKDPLNKRLPITHWWLKDKGLKDKNCIASTLFLWWFDISSSITSSGWWFQPLWKILVSLDYYSQNMENKIHVPNHQPVMFDHFAPSSRIFGRCSKPKNFCCSTLIKQVVFNTIIR